MVVCAPFAPLYASHDLRSEQTDEMLFGDEAEILDETCEAYRIRSDYGYEGWTAKTNLSDKLYSPDSIVTSSFADMLADGRYFRSPKMTLPRGARVATEDCGNGRFCKVFTPDENEFYIHKSHISPLASKEHTENEVRNSIIGTAVSYLGVQYRWGGRTPLGIDCSGLCFNAYRFNGIAIWRDAVIERSENLRKIDLSKAKKADLLFFKGHIALYLGNGRAIHSAASKGNVVIEDLKENDYLKEIFICAGTAF